MIGLEDSTVLGHQTLRDIFKTDKYEKWVLGDARTINLWFRISKYHKIIQKMIKKKIIKK